ncbi:MAG: hypothetical protein AAB368_04430, partial [bacterium]
MLNIHMEAGCDWNEATETAPRLIQVASGDFSASAYLQDNRPSHLSGFAGLFIRQDALNWVEIGMAEEWYIAVPGKVINVRQVANGVATVLAQYIPIVNPLYLMISRAGGNIVTRYKGISTTFWVDCVTTPVVYTHNEVGLYSKDTSQSGTVFFDDIVMSASAPPTNVAYFESRILDQGATPAADGIITWSKSEPGGTSAEISTQTSAGGVVWSPPSAPYSTSGATITNPKARYVRFSVTLTATPSAYPEVDWVKIEYP